MPSLCASRAAEWVAGPGCWVLGGLGDLGKNSHMVLVFFVGDARLVGVVVVVGVGARDSGTEICGASTSHMKKLQSWHRRNDLPFVGPGFLTVYELGILRGSQLQYQVPLS